jgi:hypothetical protein
MAPINCPDKKSCYRQFIRMPTLLDVPAVLKMQTDLRAAIRNSAWHPSFPYDAELATGCGQRCASITTTAIFVTRR